MENEIMNASTEHHRTNVIVFDSNGYQKTKTFKTQSYCQLKEVPENNVP